MLQRWSLLDLEGRLWAQFLSHGRRLLQPRDASSFVPGNSFNPVCPLVSMLTSNSGQLWDSWPSPSSGKPEFGVHRPQTKSVQKLRPIWRVPIINGAWRENRAKRACVYHFEPRELNGTLPSYLQAGESTTGTQSKTDCLKTDSPLVSTPHTEDPQLLLWSPRGESLHAIIQLLISTSRSWISPSRQCFSCLTNHAFGAQRGGWRAWACVSSAFRWSLTFLPTGRDCVLPTFPSVF